MYCILPFLIEMEDGYEMVKGRELSHRQIKAYFHKFFSMFGEFEIQSQYIAPTSKTHVVVIKMEPNWMLNARYIKNVDNLTSDCIDVVIENFRFIIQTARQIVDHKGSISVDVNQDAIIAKYEGFLAEQKAISDAYKKVAYELKKGLENYIKLSETIKIL